MANSPRYQGFLDPPYTVTLSNDSGATINLTGCTSNSFTLTMLNENTGQAQQGVGVWTVANQITSPGQASYQWTNNDMATAGLWWVYTTVKLPAEPNPRAFDPELILILPGTVGAGAAPPGMLPNPSPSLPFLNLRDFGGVGDGISDNTTAMFNARAAARALGGAAIYGPPGIYIFGNQDISNDKFVYHIGAGKGATVYKLKNGANTDLFSGQTNLINLAAAGGSGPTGTLYDFGFSNMTLDGNKANQTGGPSYPLRVYALSYSMQNVEVRNGYSGNILSDWQGFANFAPADSMMAQWINVKCHDSGGIGVQLGGPHDSQFVNCEFYQELSHVLHLAPNAVGAMFKNLHAWAPGVNAGSIESVLQTTYGVDTFIRGNQAGLGTSSDTQAWTEAPASGNVTAAIAANQASFTGNGGEAESAFTLGTTSVGDIDIRERFNLGGDAANNLLGVVFGFTDINNYYRASITGNAVYLQKWVAGVKSTVNSQAFTLGNSTYAYIRAQRKGTTISVKAWLDGKIEVPTWQITTTDSSLGSGKFGIGAWINSGTGVIDNFTAKSPRLQSGKVAMLQEAGGCQFDGCSIESSDTVQWALLANNTVFEGGSIYDGLPSIGAGIQIGQQPGETPYSGQILQSGGVTNGVAPVHNRISTYIQDCQGDNGALWLDNDGGYNVFDLTINQDLRGIDRIGGVHARSVLREVYDDGTHATTGQMLLDSGIMLNKAGTLSSGSGAPSNAAGSIGDYYFRTDTPSTIPQRLYVKTASAVWTELQAPAQSATAATTATGGTITTAGIDSARIAPVAAITGVILQAGTYAGQVVRVVNESAFTVTFAASGTSFVATGVLCQIAPSVACLFVWDSITSLWYPGDLQTLPVQSATAVATATGGTIATAGVSVSRVAPTANITGVILAAGTVVGQLVNVVNESAFTIVFAASGTSNVATGVLAQIAPLSSCLFQWDSITALWYPATVVLLPVQSATAVAIATSGTIATAGVDESRVSPTGAVTGVILASGTYAAQKVIVVNEAVAANTVTFAASGTSHVAQGVSVVIAGLASRLFVWDSSTSLWY